MATAVEREVDGLVRPFLISSGVLWALTLGPVGLGDGLGDVTTRMAVLGLGLGLGLSFSPTAMTGAGLGEGEGLHTRRGMEQ